MLVVLKRGDPSVMINSMPQCSSLACQELVAPYGGEAISCDPIPKRPLHKVLVGSYVSIVRKVPFEIRVSLAILIFELSEHRRASRSLFSRTATLSLAEDAIAFENVPFSLSGNRSSSVTIIPPSPAPTGVLDHHKPVAVRDLADAIEPGRLTEGVHREDGLRAGSDGVLDGVRVGVRGVRLDVHEHRLRPLIEDAVAGRDEAERSRSLLSSKE